MGNSWSSTERRRRNSYFDYQHPHSLPPPPPSYYHHPPPPSGPSYSYSNSQYPPPIPPNYSFPGWNPSYAPATSSTATGVHYHPPAGFYGGYQSYGGLTPPAPSPAPSPAPYVEFQSAKKVKNDVNVHKESIRLEVDPFNPDQYLVSFVLDASFDGSITIYYFAKEEDNCKLKPLLPQAFMPVKVPFQKGLGQKFQQPSGTGIDLGFFMLDELAKPSDEEAYPLVISAQVSSSSRQTDNASADDEHLSPSLQITQAVIEKNNEGPFKVKVIKQILWIDGMRYELRELYGIAEPSQQDCQDDDLGKDCVICMTEPKDTAVIPCRHMCLCSGCAKELRLRSNKCPICRQPITELIEIKLDANG